MSDFQFINIPGTDNIVILDPRRSQRPDISKKQEHVCPFCVGREKQEKEKYRVGGREGDPHWQILVIDNIYPVCPIHEIIIHSPDHHKNFDELPPGQIELILKTYRNRAQKYKKQGHTLIFHNRGIGGGESIPHSHSQMTVIPKNIALDMPPLDPSIYKKNIFFKQKPRPDLTSSDLFHIYCPLFSQWPDEVWLAPRRKNTYFTDINDKEISDLAFVLQRLIFIFDQRHGHEFPFNLYIYPGKNWYLRIIPRSKILGGFELASNITVNTQDPRETLRFINEHLFEADLYKIRLSRKENLWKSI